MPDLEPVDNRQYFNGYITRHPKLIPASEKISLAILLIGLVLNFFKIENTEFILITGSLLTAITYLLASFRIIDTSGLENTGLLNSHVFINFFYRLYYLGLCVTSLLTTGFVIKFIYTIAILIIIPLITLCIVLIFSIKTKVSDRFTVYNSTFYVRIFPAILLLIYLIFYKYNPQFSAHDLFDNIFSKNKTEDLLSTVTDIDGNLYKTVRIGTQVWMAENLKTTRYSNGDLIGTTTPSTLNIEGERGPKYQWACSGNESYVAVYGRLYTWYAVKDRRKLCPVGWHVPSIKEWQTLTHYLTMNGFGYGGSGSDIAKSMAATSKWKSDETPGNVGNEQANNNSSGFTAFPSDSRPTSGQFYFPAWLCNWWSSSKSGSFYGYSVSMHCDRSYVEGGGTNMSWGMSVRCVRN